MLSFINYNLKWKSTCVTFVDLLISLTIIWLCVKETILKDKCDNI